MSGNNIGTIVGGAIGFIAAGPTGLRYGMSIGGVLGGMLMPDTVGTQDQYGPRLSDLKVTSATYGVSVTDVYGAYRIGGNLIFATPITEVTHVREEEVGKGGSETYDVTTYSYNVTMAIAFCTGPVEGIRRVWADSVKIYDIDEGGPTVSFLSTEQASGVMNFYYGTPTQDVDWVMQSYNPDSPAYRNVCYIVFNKFQLEKFGGRIPNITAEIVTKTESNNNLPRLYSGATIDVTSDHYNLFDAFIGPVSSLLSFGLYQKTQGDYLFEYPSSYGFHFDDIDGVVYEDFGTYGNVAKTSTDERGHFLTKNRSGFFKISYWVPENGSPFSYAFVDNGPLSQNGVETDSGNWLLVRNKKFYAVHKQVSSADSYDDTIFVFNMTDYEDQQYTENGICYPDSSKEYTIPCSDYQVFIDIQSTEFDETKILIDLSSLVDASSIDYTVGFFVSDNYFLCVKWHTVGSTRIFDLRTYDLVTGAFIDEVQLNLLNDYGLQSLDWNFYALNDDLYYLAVQLGDGKFRVWQYTRATNVVYLGEAKAYADPNAYPPTESNHNEMMWSNRYGSIYANEHFLYLSGAINTGLFEVRHNAVAIFSLINFDNGEVTLASIVEDLFLQSDLTPDQYDVSDGESTIVTGFVKENVMEARSAIATLQSIYLFDIVEEEFKLVLKMRGGETPISISQEELIDDVVITNQLDTELPKSITVNYSNVDRDYLIGTQTASRIDGNSDHNLTLDLPISFTDDESKQLSEKLMASTWARKIEVTFSMPFDERLLVSKIINLNYDGIEYNLRINAIDYETDSRIKCSCSNESNLQYASSAIGQDTSDGFTPYQTDIVGSSIAAVFNAPALSNITLDAYGLYYVAGGFLDTWRGCGIYKSKDEGQNYTSIGVILKNVYIGRATTKLAVGLTTLWDLTNSVTIESGNGAPLESFTDESMLSGKGYALLGNEVIQYGLAVDNGDSTYTISKLLRGRRGTEWAVSTHAIGDRFIFLDLTETQFDFSTYNVERLYKAATFGQYLDDILITTKATYDKTNLIPFSPSALFYTRTAGTDVISWKRRDRYIRGHLKQLPLSETTQNFKIEVRYVGTSIVESVLLTTLYSTSETVTYTAAQKAIDGVLINNALRYTISQESSDYGFGYSSEIETDYIGYLGYVYTNANNFWRFDEPIGSTAHIDVLGSRNISGSVQTTYELTGSLPLSPSTSVLKKYHTNNLFYRDSRFTCTFRFNVAGTTANGEMMRIGFTGNGVARWYVKMAGSRYVRFGSDGSYPESVQAKHAIDAVWVTVTVSHDGTTQRLYLDGLLKASNNYPLYYVSVPYWHTCGVYGYDSDLHIDEMIYFSNNVLTDTEIKELYDMQLLETE